MNVSASPHARATSRQHLAGGNIETGTMMGGAHLVARHRPRRAHSDASPVQPDPTWCHDAIGVPDAATGGVPARGLDVGLDGTATLVAKVHDDVVG